jgi:hypothetical protein
MNEKRAPTDHRAVGGYIALFALASAAMAVLLFAAFSGGPGNGSNQGTFTSRDRDVAAESDADELGETVVADPVVPVPEDEPACSQFGGLAPSSSDRPILSPAVTDTVEAVSAAASACDVEALNALMTEDFVYAYGQSGRQEAFKKYRDLEADDEPITATLVGLLELRPAVTVDGTYVWPEQTQWDDDDWAEIPDADLDALAHVYGQEDVGAWVTSGEFTGYRLGITGDGRWFFFLDS